MALDAQLVAMSASGRRTLTSDEFFRGPLTVALEPGEILVEVRFPIPAPATGWAFAELSRRHGDFAIVCACALVEVDGSGACTRASIALGGVSGTPVRCGQAETMLAGQRFDDGVVPRAAASVIDAIDPEDDLHASAAYRRAMAQAYAERVVGEAWRRAQRKGD
jgi:CO/xanthine dehydrogenase FAD-binding subunit